MVEGIYVLCGSYNLPRLTLFYSRTCTLMKNKARSALNGLRNSLLSCSKEACLYQPPTCETV